MKYSSNSSNPSVFDLLVPSFKDFKDCDALIFKNNSISYAKLEILVNIVAQRIINEAPSEKIIAISCSRSIMGIVNLLGVLAAGKAYLPLDFDQPQNRLLQLIKETEVKFGLKGLESDDFSSIGLKTVEGKLVQNIKEDNYRSDISYILFTSGTTGFPKGIVVRNSSLINFLTWQANESKSSPGFKTLHFAKLNFDVSFQEIFSTLLSGGTLLIEDNETLQDPFILLEYIQKNNVNRLFLPFIALQGLVNAATAFKLYPESLREIMTAGEELKVGKNIRTFFEELNYCRLFNQYGPTETTIIVSQNQMPNDPAKWSDLPSLGKPITNVTMVLISIEGRLIDHMGEIGEIHIAGDALANGYYQNEHLTKEKFIHLDLEGKGLKRYFKTGDLAEWNALGELAFKGRIDDQVKINGSRVELGEVEVNAANIDGLEENAVVTASYPDGQLYIVLYYVSNVARISGHLIRQRIAAFLPEYMVPSKYIRINKMPRTSSGKIDRNALVNELNENESIGNDSIPKATEVQKALTAIWVELLHDSNFSQESNFFQSGGSSILAQKLSLMIAEQFGKRFPVAMIYQNPTLRSQLFFLGGEKKNKQKEKIEEPIKEVTKNKDVAIIAMSGKFPGANDAASFWELIRNEREGISFFEADELDPLISKEAKDPNYIPARGIMEGYDKFDPSFFGMNPKLASVMDPQQRKFLEISHEVMEKAGWISNRPEFKIGVFAGTNNNTYFNRNIVHSPELEEIFGATQIMALNEKDYVSSRIAFQLNLTGPAVSIYSACSTSLLAVAQAVMSIRSGQCAAAIAGGSSVTFPAKSGHKFQDGAIYSKDGHCRPFDKEGTGTLFCDGAGAVLLKDYELAKADGDKIFAVIKGIGISNDGLEKASFTSPSVKGQAESIKAALRDAHISADEIGYVETHGTATPIGDPIEIEGLKLAYGKGLKNSCAIGSVKSNVGHLTAAAGIAGLIKTVYALHEKILPASLGFENLNPEINFGDSPFYVNNHSKDWESDKKRIAGVSSFGFGGTNVHIILEEVKSENESIEQGEKDVEQLIVLSGKTEASLQANAKKLHDFIINHPNANFENISANLLNRFVNYGRNMVFSTKSKEDLNHWLSGIKNNKTPALLKKGEFHSPVFLFPGQGSQYIGMGKELYESNRVFKNSFDECSGLFDKYLGTSLTQMIFHGTPESLSKTNFTQPAIFTVSYALSKMLSAWGINPVALCGHSIGEYVAAHLSGVFSLKDAVKIVANRGRLINQLPEGKMLSIQTQLDILSEILVDDISLAAHNGPNNCVVSGESSAIKKFQVVLDGYRIPNQVLKTSHAFHSSMMDGALEEFSKVLASVKLNIHKIPIQSTQTGKWLNEKEAVSPDYWLQHIRNPVVFNDSAKSILSEIPDAYFVEVGPGNVLSILIQKQEAAKNFVVMPCLSRGSEENEYSYLIRQIGRSLALGANIDLSKIRPYSSALFLDIPTYSFEENLCWNQQGALLNKAFSKENILEKPTESNSQAKLEEVPVVPTTSVTDFERVKVLLESASGTVLNPEDIGSSFFELGLDSLSLTQFTFLIKKEFGLEITFRQINEELNTPAELLDYIAQNLPSRIFKVLENGRSNGHALEEEEKSETRMDLIQRQLAEIQSKLLEIQASAYLTPVLHTNGIQKKVNGIEVDATNPIMSHELKEGGSVYGLDENQLSSGAISFLNKLEASYLKKHSKSKEYQQSIYANQGVKDHNMLNREGRIEKFNFPIISKFSDGSKLVDLDGNEYLDWHFNYGSRLFGYNADFITNALKSQIEKGLEFGSHLDKEEDVCQLFKKLTGTDQVLLFNQVPETLVKAISICQMISKKSLIVILSIDDQEAQFDSGTSRDFEGDIQNQDFLKESFPDNLLVLNSNLEESLNFIRARSNEIAAVLVQVKVTGNSGLGLLESLNLIREVTKEEQVLMVLNEVQTGVNTYKSGMSQLMTSKADMLVFGNLVGEGLPLGILGINWKSELADQESRTIKSNLSKTKFVRDFTGDSFVLAATAALLQELDERGGEYLDKLSQKSSELIEKMNEIFVRYNCDFFAVSFRTIWKIQAKSEGPFWKLFFILLRSEGIHIWSNIPCFLTGSHTRIDMEQTLVKIEKVIALMIEHDLMQGDLPDLDELVMDTNHAPFPGAKIGLDKEGNPFWISPQTIL